MRRARGFTLIELLVVIAIIGVLSTLLMPALLKAKERGNQTKCGSNLSQIAKGAFQYADDWRFYPHISKGAVLDGGASSDTASRCMRALIWNDNVDNCELFVCPSSPDQWVAMPTQAKADGRTWTWTQYVGSSTLLPSPIVKSMGDPALTATAELSYGWTMRQINSSCSSQVLVVSDKSKRQIMSDYKGTAIGPAHVGNMIGNHKECMLAATVDSHLYRATPATPGINTSNIASLPGGGYDGGMLGVLNDDGPGG